MPTRAPTAADTALLARIPEDLRAACRPTTAFAEGADAGWDCFAPSGGFAYGYSGFPTTAARDAFFDGIVSALDARKAGDCAAGDAVVEAFSRSDGTTGQLVCSTTGTTRAFYWAVDGGSDLGIAIAQDKYRPARLLRDCRTRATSAMRQVSEAGPPRFRPPLP